MNLPPVTDHSDRRMTLRLTMMPSRISAKHATESHTTKGLPVMLMLAKGSLIEEPAATAFETTCTSSEYVPDRASTRGSPTRRLRCSLLWNCPLPAVTPFAGVSFASDPGAETSDKLIDAPTAGFPCRVSVTTTERSVLTVP